MSEADIFPLLKLLAGGRVYPYVVKLNAQGEPAVSPPWLVFSLVTHVDSDVLCGQAESALTVQVDVYSKTIDEAATIRMQAQQALKPLAPVNINRTSGYEQDTKLYRATLEVQIWH
ncbi:tail completion protein gp17 [Citrobacter braakii]|jgi:hypothetical protein|uniref:tail completion protein gp17 n=1 Tax=Citrobacter braakii TaxID=57706 RepID=UPI0019077C82|nr:DUF3168 domain-containing protein [Citrobacter braakii]ELK6840337.1 DUF3168 domain-containing protein [Citrobacter braakii]MBJ8848553.1 DUF3168 domain-containing protein [Citrobacter braakii]